MSDGKASLEDIDAMLAKAGFGEEELALAQKATRTLANKKQLKAEAKKCEVCSASFGVFKKRYTCHQCVKIVCGNCSGHQKGQDGRVCNNCDAAAAPVSNRGKTSEVWPCPTCEFENTPDDIDCFACGTERGSTPLRAAAGAVTAAPASAAESAMMEANPLASANSRPPSAWSCLECTHTNAPWNFYCDLCYSDKPKGAALDNAERMATNVTDLRQEVIKTGVSKVAPAKLSEQTGQDLTTTFTQIFNTTPEAPLPPPPAMWDLFGVEKSQMIDTKANDDAHDDQHGLHDHEHADAPRAENDAAADLLNFLDTRLLGGYLPALIQNGYDTLDKLRPLANDDKHPDRPKVLALLNTPNEMLSMKLLLSDLLAQDIQAEKAKAKRALEFAAKSVSGGLTALALKRKKQEEEEEAMIARMIAEEQAKFEAEEVAAQRAEREKAAKRAAAEGDEAALIAFMIAEEERKLIEQEQKEKAEQAKKRASRMSAEDEEAQLIAQLIAEEEAKFQQQEEQEKTEQQKKAISAKKRAEEARKARVAAEQDEAAMIEQMIAAAQAEFEKEEAESKNATSALNAAAEDEAALIQRMIEEEMEKFRQEEEQFLSKEGARLSAEEEEARLIADLIAAERKKDEQAHIAEKSKRAAAEQDEMKMIEELIAKEQAALLAQEQAELESNATRRSAEEEEAFLIQQMIEEERKKLEAEEAQGQAETDKRKAAEEEEMRLIQELIEKDRKAAEQEYIDASSKQKSAEEEEAALIEKMIAEARAGMGASEMDEAEKARLLAQATGSDADELKQRQLAKIELERLATEKELAAQAAREKAKKQEQENRAKRVAQQVVQSMKARRRIHKKTEAGPQPVGMLARRARLAEAKRLNDSVRQKEEQLNRQRLAASAAAEQLSATRTLQQDLLDHLKGDEESLAVFTEASQQYYNNIINAKRYYAIIGKTFGDALVPVVVPRLLNDMQGDARKKQALRHIHTSAMSARCGVCKKLVYIGEGTNMGKKTMYHKSCFTCCEPGCTTALTGSNSARYQGKIYCKPHKPQVLLEAAPSNWVTF